MDHTCWPDAPITIAEARRISPIPVATETALITKISESHQWIENQLSKLLPAQYYLITFTLPKQLHSKTKQYQTKTVTGEFFLYLLMLHVLPKGFRRARNYGFLHPCSKKLIRILQMVLRVNPFRMLKKVKERAKIACPVCGAKMKIILTMIQKPQGRQHVYFT